MKKMLQHKALKGSPTGHEAAAEHMPGYIHAHPELGVNFDRRTPPPDRFKRLQSLGAA